jgi:hypothetical protein
LAGWHKVATVLPMRFPRFDLAHLRNLEAIRAEGPQPEQAVAECVSAQIAMAELGLWPGPRSEAMEREITLLRAKWATIQKRARQIKTGLK